MDGVKMEVTLTLDRKLKAPGPEALRRADALLLRLARMDIFNVEGTYWKDEIADVRASLRLSEAAGS